MLFHLSLVAADPKRVSKVLAELMAGEYLEFPAVANAYIAFANDDLGTAIEVYPLKTTLEQGLGQEPVEFGQEHKASYPSGVHVALKTPLSAQEVMDIGAREGWRTVACSRGNFFHVIELWVENSFLLELITPDKKEQAVDFHNSQSWARAISS